MAHNPATYSTRTLSLIMLAAFAGMALWIFQPWDNLTGSGSSGGDDASASLAPALQIDGPVQTETADGEVTRLVIPLMLDGDSGVSLDGSALRAETALAETALAAVPAIFELAWDGGNGDRILDPGERATLTVDLPTGSSVRADNPLSLVFQTADGGRFALEDVLSGE